MLDKGAPRLDPHAAAVARYAHAILHVPVQITPWTGAAALGAACDERDGLKLSWPDRWLHLRASGTEPVSRLIVEAPDGHQADALVRDTCRAIGCQPLKGHA